MSALALMAVGLDAFEHEDTDGLSDGRNLLLPSPPIFDRLQPLVRDADLERFQVFLCHR